MYKIALLGAGNLATCLAHGLTNKAGFANVFIYDIDPQQTQRLQQANDKVHICDDVQTLVTDADAIVFCVKPQHARDAIRPLQTTLANQALISVAAGIDTATLCDWSQTKQWIRSMPNLPVTVGMGMTALYATEKASSQQRQLAEDIFTAVGEVVWLDTEHDMSLVTALSGSGPAYFFYVLNAMLKAAKELGLEQTLAHQLIVRTALGTLTLAQSSNKEWSEWCDLVASKGGTTEQALNVFKHKTLDKVFKQAIEAATQRCHEITQQHAKKSD